MRNAQILHRLPRHVGGLGVAQPLNLVLDGAAIEAVLLDLFDDVLLLAAALVIVLVLFRLRQLLCLGGDLALVGYAVGRVVVGHFVVGECGW